MFLILILILLYIKTTIASIAMKNDVKIEN